jgi:hypothetical protein
MEELRMSHSKSPFLRQVRDLIRVKHLSYRTEEAYLGWIRRFILFHEKRHPKEMGAAEVQAFLTHLAVKHTVSALTQDQALSALLFLLPESPKHRFAAARKIYAFQ